jgi:acyl-coenzyme A synthetase/AMP-(fatty) acid ligase
VRRAVGRRVARSADGSRNGERAAGKAANHVNPLLIHESPVSVVAYRGGRPIEARQFLADARQLAERMPSGKYVLNVCVDRYHFSVGFAACLMADKVNLLPSTHAPEFVRQLAPFAPNAFCLTDRVRCDIDLPRFRYPRELGEPKLRRAAVTTRDSTASYCVPNIPQEQIAAIVFTSGSTGTPVPYKKTWGRLTRCVRDGASRLGLLDGRAHTLIGTVPAQHMYGLESTVLLALQSGNAFAAERPFYPADICAAIAAAPRPRALVSTPIHLRTLLAAGIDLPPLDLIVSATAPLTQELAREAEDRFKTRLVEIYGSTESGQIATRRTADTAVWRLWPGVRLRTDQGQVYAEGGHLEQSTPMCDVLEITGEDEFLLHGRTADLVNIAGKRSSFGYLNAQLIGIPGVIDGAFFLRGGGKHDGGERDGGGTGIARLAAAVVAPGLDANTLVEHLRRRIDPVFLPRPLLMVDRLPRNATGKLPLQALQALCDRPSRRRGPPKGSS